VTYGNKILMNILLNLKHKPEALKKGQFYFIFYFIYLFCFAVLPFSFFAF
jgi:hypothetical protein